MKPPKNTEMSGTPFGRNATIMRFHDVLDTLSSSYEGVLALHRMMQSGAEPKMAGRRSVRVQGGLGEAELSSMMRDPKYWRDRDLAYVAKVTQGFENLYGK
jgi:hypothetical protein